MKIYRTWCLWDFMRNRYPFDQPNHLIFCNYDLKYIRVHCKRLATPEYNVCSDLFFMCGCVELGGVQKLDCFGTNIEVPLWITLVVLSKILAGMALCRLTSLFVLSLVVELHWHSYLDFCCWYFQLLSSFLEPMLRKSARHWMDQSTHCLPRWLMVRNASTRFVMWSGHPCDLHQFHW